MPVRSPLCRPSFAPKVCALLLAVSMVAPVLATAQPAAASHDTSPNVMYDANGPDGTVHRLYRAYFLRKPDRGGYDYWLAQYRNGYPLTSISENFARSREFSATYGSVGDRRFVELVYNNVLGRDPDAGGYDYWVRQMQAGMPRGVVMINFSDSVEYRAKTADLRPPMDLRAHDVLNLGSEACTAQGVRGVSWSVTLTDGTAWQGKLDELVPSGSRIRAYTSNAEVLYVTVDVTEFGSGHFCSLGEQRGPVGMPAMQPTAAPPSTLTKGQRTVAAVHDPQLTCTGGPDVRAEFSWTVTLNDGSIHFGYHTFDVKAGTTAERSYEWYPPNPDDPEHDFVATVQNGQGPYGGSVNCAFRSQ